ncbi:MAG: hypothetical protein IIY06_01375, partial [Proteobacteria bacterium]|nr:hypothetical protein [Pseudomonadota bacterium]
MRKMHRTSLYSLVGLFIIVMGCFMTMAACSKKTTGEASTKYGSDTLKLYLPGEYMSDTLIPNFEKQFGVKVIVELFDSNEMMY